MYYSFVLGNDHVEYQALFRQVTCQQNKKHTEQNNKN